MLYYANVIFFHMLDDKYHTLLSYIVYLHKYAGIGLYMVHTYCVLRTHRLWYLSILMHACYVTSLVSNSLGLYEL